jgi:hypothetical protein
MSAALVPGLVFVVVATVVGVRYRARRRFERLRVSGGRKALVLNLVDRSR